MKVTGKIKSIGEVENIKGKDGKEWKKTSFTLETNEKYNNLYAFEIFGTEKVEKFIKFNKVGHNVDVDFNVQTREWKDKYFTTLQCWKIFKAKEEKPEENLNNSDESENSDLPF